MKARLRNFGTLVILSVLALVVLDRVLPLEEVIGLVLDSRPLYLVVAAGLIVGGLVVNAFVYRVLLGHFGYAVGIRTLVVATLKARFVGNTIPSMGVSGLAVIDYYLRDEGIDSKVSKRVLVLKNVASAIASLLILVAGFLMFVHTRPSWRALIVPGILTAVVLLGFIYTGYLVSEVRRLRRLVRGLESVFGRLVRPAGPRLRRIAVEIVDGVRYARKNRDKLVFPVMCNLIGTGILAVTVYLIFIALDTPVTLGSVAVGFISATLIGSASMLPGGVGAFETTMAASYRGVGIGLEEAAAAVLLFRVMSFWVPTAVGGIMVRSELKEIRDHLRTFLS